MKKMFHSAASLLLLSALSAHLSTARAQGTAFTYQGQLQNNGSLASGTYNLTFTLFNTNTSGAPIAGPLTNNAVSVTNGLFTVRIDFGLGVSSGQTNWLEIGVETNGASAFTPLTPLQELTPAPSAIYAESAGGLPGLVVQPNSDGAPNLIGGASVNFAGAGTVGATVGGGGAAGSTNSVAADYGTVGGGAGNTVTEFGPYSTVDGGYNNMANSGYAAIGGGVGNLAGNLYACVGGGFFNQATGPGSFVGGGGFTGLIFGGNTASGGAAMVGGGYANVASGTYATVPGGAQNVAGGQGSFAAGQNAQANDPGSFVWGDGTRAARSQGSNSFAVLATGGVFFYTTSNNLNVEMDNTGDLDFGTTTRQMLNLYGTSYGIGVQNNDEYFRSGDEFFWYVGGSHNNINGNAGGGTQTMELDTNGNLFVTGAVTASGTGPSGFTGFFTNAGTGSGVAGHVAYGEGVDGFSGGGGTGVSGYSVDGDGVSGESGGPGTAGVYGLSTGGGDGVHGESDSIGAGVYGENSGGGLAGQFDGNVDITGTLSFGNEIAQMLNLYGTTYGLGVQSNDEYFRTAGQFYWYLGGTPNTINGSSGGGTTLMALSTSGLTVNGMMSFASDRNLKEHFQPVDTRQVLAQVAALPISRWNYKTDAGTAHLGPMAQDFYAAFNVGPDDRHIATVDEGGVALAAIQGLNQKVEEKEARIQEQAAQIAELKQSVAELKEMVQTLAEKK